MSKLSVNYLGLTLKNPIIAGSSSLTNSVERVAQLEEAGVGAVVLKSLFEEQIGHHVSFLNKEGETGEAYDYLSNYVKDNTVENYLNLIKGAKEACSIPIIASVNCYSDGSWIEYAKAVEKAGADALELNLFFLPNSKEENGAELEKKYLDIIQHVVKQVNIPVSVKLSQNFTNPLWVINQCYFRGVKGIVMYNRYYEPDIDIDSVSVVSAPILSNRLSNTNVLRWLALASADIDKLDYSASSSIHTGADVVKMLLSGASTVQLCSVLYNEGLGIVKMMLHFIDKWLEEHTYENIGEVIGLLDNKNYTASSTSVEYQRVQFMKYFSDFNK